MLSSPWVTAPRRPERICRAAYATRTPASCQHKKLNASKVDRWGLAMPHRVMAAHLFRTYPEMRPLPQGPSVRMTPPGVTPASQAVDAVRYICPATLQRFWNLAGGCQSSGSLVWDCSSIVCEARHLVHNDVSSGCDAQFRPHWQSLGSEKRGNSQHQ
jgi:hypothetical protein